MKENWRSKSIFNWWPWTRKNIAPICIWSSWQWNVYSKAIRWFKAWKLYRISTEKIQTPQECVSVTFKTLPRGICWVLGAKCTNLIFCNLIVLNSYKVGKTKQFVNVICGFTEMLFFTLGSFLKMKWMKIWRETIALVSSESIQEIPYIMVK